MCALSRLGTYHEYQYARHARIALSKHDHGMHSYAIQLILAYMCRRFNDEKHGGGIQQHLVNQKREGGVSLPSRRPLPHSPGRHHKVNICGGGLHGRAARRAVTVLWLNYRSESLGWILASSE